MKVSNAEKYPELIIKLHAVTGKFQMNEFLKNKDF